MFQLSSVTNQLNDLREEFSRRFDDEIRKIREDAQVNDGEIRLIQEEGANRMDGLEEQVQMQNNTLEAVEGRLETEKNREKWQARLFSLLGIFVSAGSLTNAISVYKYNETVDVVTSRVPSDFVNKTCNVMEIASTRASNSFTFDFMLTENIKRTDEEPSLAIFLYDEIFEQMRLSIYEEALALYENLTGSFLRNDPDFGAATIFPRLRYNTILESPWEKKVEASFAQYNESFPLMSSNRCWNLPNSNKYSNWTSFICVDGYSADRASRGFTAMLENGTLGFEIEEKCLNCEGEFSWKRPTSLVAGMVPSYAKENKRTTFGHTTHAMEVRGVLSVEMSLPCESRCNSKGLLTSVMKAIQLIKKDFPYETTCKKIKRNRDDKGGKHLESLVVNSIAFFFAMFTFLYYVFC